MDDDYRQLVDVNVPNSVPQADVPEFEARLRVLASRRPRDQFAWFPFFFPF